MSTPPSAKNVLVLTEIIDAIRSGRARTRPEVETVTGLGRTVVADRIAEGLDLGLLAEGELTQPERGRPSRTVRFRSEAGMLLSACLGALECYVGVATLDGRLLQQRQGPIDVAEGPRATLERVDRLLRDALAAVDPVPVWGIGVGLPGPVDFRSGCVVAPPIMPGWDGFDVRGWFAARYEAPIWVDNEVNLMALGEWEHGSPRDARDLLYLKVGTGLGSGLVTGGRLHRGDTGAAGDIGHVRVTDDPAAVCRCGKSGCLEAVVGGWALARSLEALARAGRSEFLATRLAEAGRLQPVDVGAAVSAGDPVVIDVVRRTARVAGRAVAGVVNFANPGVLVIGGGALRMGELFVEEVRRTVMAEAIELACAHLVIRQASLDFSEGVLGATSLVAHQLFDRDSLGLWLADGTPIPSARKLHSAA